MREEPKSETRAERIERYRKLLRTWQEYESLRLAVNAVNATWDTRLEHVNHVSFCERIAPEGQRK